ncbi:MAG: hypothetical protein Unbinned2299contig1000_66 [Prokaryotic dsDNA virus sp.]|jgi:hypothetical protein|nr:MAG: hypothetical protein Unbinned2299contig1000_66 [Prokaryotic dsDNA virus sp.]|tara:strand:+ start:1106 stop:1306 length:201 start_codon:yes stop_codon:yes gene_type:complete
MKLTGNPNYDHDYTVKNGRLINNAPPLEMGITKMCNMKKSKKRMEKILMKVEADEIAEERRRFMDR